MKKIITLVLAVMLVACVGMTAFAAETLITGLDATDINAYMGTVDLSYYGIELASVTAGAGDDGNGAHITTSTATGNVQSFLITDADTLSTIKTNFGTDKYISVYVKNASDYAFGLRFNFNDTSNGMIIFDCSQCVLVAKDGSKPEIQTSEGGGTGANTSVLVPANFEGYVYYDCSALTLNAPDAWARPAFSGFENLANLEIDLRWMSDANFAGCDVTLDSISFVDEIPETADVSVIAYAAAAIAGLGALAVAKKR